MRSEVRESLTELNGLEREPLPMSDQVHESVAAGEDGSIPAVALGGLNVLGSVVGEKDFLGSSSGAFGSDTVDRFIWLHAIDFVRQDHRCEPIDDLWVFHVQDPVPMGFASIG
jgi:hypothetical protein